MPRPKNPEELVKVTLNLNLADYDRLKVMYPQHGPQKVIRALVKAHVNRVTRRVAETTEALVPELTIDLTEAELATEE